MKKPHIVIVGSSNTDMVARASRLPRPGETVLGDSFAIVPGGKGANQAVAAARLGASVSFVARVGADVFGDNAVRGYAEEGIDTSRIIRDPDAPTGVALIGVSSETGENCIIVTPGANANLSPADVQAAADMITSADIVVCQLEVPIETVSAAFELARQAGIRTILNPAPAHRLPASLLRLISIITPNETEAALLVDSPSVSPERAAARLHADGVDTVVVTTGSDGAIVSTGNSCHHIPGRRVSEVVDTTAAGDCFTGALAVGLAEGMSVMGAVEFANAAAALSVTKAGAQPSLPRRARVDEFLNVGS